MNDIFKIKEFDKKNRKKKHIIFICDHASKNIPLDYKNLGLSPKYINSHISWDIGARELTIGLTKKLEQSCFLSNFSRLIIDPNRPLDSLELIVEQSDNIKIFGNRNLSIQEKKERIKKIYNPYHNSLEQFIKRKQRDYNHVALVAIHTFSKRYKGTTRGLKVGLLWNKNINMFISIQNNFIKKNITFGRNYPYSGFFYNYTLDRHSRNGELNNIALEIRNDLLCNQKRIKKYIKLLSEPLSVFVND
mgnify:FL=1